MARPKRDTVKRYVKKHGNGYWYAYPERLSTGSKEERLARQWLSQFEAGAKTVARPDVLLVSTILDRYLERKKDTRSGGLRYSVSSLKKHLGDLLPNHLTEEVIDDYRDKRRADGYLRGNKENLKKYPLSDGTIATDVRYLRAAVNWAQDRGWLDKAPVIAMPVKASPPRNKWLKKDQAAKFLCECKQLHLEIYVLLGLYTTARHGAIVDLTWEWTDFETKIVDYGQGNGNKNRSIVPMHPKLQEGLLKARRLAVSDFVVEYSGKQVKSVRTSFSRAAKRAGMPWITPHVLRHTGATWMASEGVSMEKIAQFMNITEEVAKKHYAKFHPDYMNDQMMALSF